MPNLPRKKTGRIFRKPPEGSTTANYAALAEDIFAANGFVGKSLLRSVCGAIRCARPKNSLLVKLVDEGQGIYAALLGRLMSGASLSAASVACGLQRQTVAEWLAQGLLDIEENGDTYYSRFASDVHAALAHSVSEAEIAVMRRNPIEYLRTGPGRAFYAREQYWQQLPPELVPPDDLHPLSENGPSIETTSLTEDRMRQALSTLKQSGILGDPTYAHELAAQHGIQHTDQANNVGVAENMDPTINVEGEGGPDRG